MSYGQKWSETIYYNRQWDVSNKDSATYYRTTTKVDTLFLICDYWIDGTLQMRGLSSTYGNSLSREGEYKYYYKNGKLSSKENYSNKLLHGEYIKYFENGDIYSTRQYVQGKPEGIFKYYFENGKIRRYENYVEGELVEKKCYTKEGKDTVYYASNRFPIFNEGKETINEYISKNIKYPKEARKNEITGSANVRFTVERDGTVSEVYTKDEIDESLKEEAIRVVSEMPQWIPGANDDVLARVKYTVKIRFTL
jgi:TonB family protein